MERLRRLGDREPRARVAVGGLAAGWPRDGHFRKVREEALERGRVAFRTRDPCRERLLNDPCERLLDVDAADARVFISKLYVLAAHRKSGAGRMTLDLIESMARDLAAHTLWLTVNKGNPSVRAYERLGFAIVESLVVDIGGGFVMDDYRMERAVPAAQPSPN